MSFEWDPNKAGTNRKKHGIDFADAVIVLEDTNAITSDDPDYEEARYITIGMDASGRILVVVYKWREDVIRIISARKATNYERKQYEEWTMRNEYDFSKGKRGPVIDPDPNKVRITIRLDADIVKYFKDQVHKAGGGNYQTMINNALREYIEEIRSPLNEKILRQVIREELKVVH